MCVRTLKFDFKLFLEQKMPTPFQKQWSSLTQIGLQLGSRHFRLWSISFGSWMHCRLWTFAFLFGVHLVASWTSLSGCPAHFYTDDFGLDRGQLGLETSDSSLEDMVWDECEKDLAALAWPVSAVACLSCLPLILKVCLYQGIYIECKPNTEDAWDAKFWGCRAAIFSSTLLAKLFIVRTLNCAFAHLVTWNAYTSCGQLELFHCEQLIPRAFLLRFGQLRSSVLTLIGAKTSRAIGFKSLQYPSTYLATLWYLHDTLAYLDQLDPSTFAKNVEVREKGCLAQRKYWPVYIRVLSWRLTAHLYRVSTSFGYVNWSLSLFYRC